MKKTIMLLLASLAVVMSGCGVAKEISKQVERTPGEIADYAGSDFVLVASQGSTELYLNPSTATIRWQDKASGTYHDTRVFDDSIGDETLKNDLITYYYSGSDADLYASSSSMDSYTYSVQNEGVTYEKIENGVKIVYSIGNNKVTYKDFPFRMTDARMQELIIPYCDEKDLRLLKKQYRQNMDTTWSRTSNANNPLAGLSADQLYTLFYEKAQYSFEELIVDNTEWEKLDELPERQKLTVPVDYYLDNGDLVANINTAEIEYNASFPLKSLTFLPYFLSSKSMDGYLFVPDGSGALIDFDNTKTKEYQFSSRFFNGDLLQTASTYSTTRATLMAPVFGMKEDDHAVLGIIESGAENATLSAYIKNSFNSIPYSRISLSFAIREDQSLASFVGATTNYTLRRLSTDYYADPIRIRYRWLSGDEADYSGMAASYREYLLENGGIKENAAEETAPMFVEFLGYTDAIKYFLGIPYKGKTVITDFEAAEAILKDMAEKGIRNIKVDYRGIANGGTLQRAAENVKIGSELGGKSGFSALLKTAESLGAEVFPDFQLQTVNTKKGLSKDKKAFFISGEMAQIYDFRLVSRKPDDEDKYPTFLVSPSYIADYVSNFSKSYGKLGTKNLASEDFFTFITADYKKDKNVSLTTASYEFDKAFETLSKDYRLMLSNPMYKAWAGTTYVTDLPFYGQGFKVVDHYVPFMEMVLSGSVTYSSERFNTNSYDMTDKLLKAVEYGSAIKFRFIGTDIGNLENTEESDVFMAEYSALSENAAELYAAYAAFYDKVKGARLISHDIIGNDDDHIVTTWSNGVKVYINYSDEETDIDGVTVAPMSYETR